ncbi:MAG: hypothetical protein ACE3L7_25675 [Candidatus Pristimantibacillus sp.]
MIERLEELAARCINLEAELRDRDARIKALEKANTLLSLKGGEDNSRTAMAAVRTSQDAMAAYQQSQR